MATLNMYGGYTTAAGKPWENIGTMDFGSSLDTLVNNYNKMYAEAKAANEARYQQMLGIADQTTNQRMADVRENYAKQRSSALSNLARTGMANTTVAPTMQAGFAREEQSALNTVADALQQTKLGIMERRTDEYPDLAALQSLLAGIGSQGGASGMQAMLDALANIGGSSSGSAAAPAAVSGGGLRPWGGNAPAVNPNAYGA